MYCDDVKVPWERVFIYKDTDTARAQFQDTYAHYMQNYQAMTRLMVKMQFQVGVAAGSARLSAPSACPMWRKSWVTWRRRPHGRGTGLRHGIQSGGGMYNGYYYVPDRNLMYTRRC